MDLENNIFMLAGPVKMHPRVLRAMSAPARAHRAPDFKEVHRDIRDLLKYAFRTDNDVCVFSGSGTAAMESSVVSFFNKNDKVVSIHNGKFGERLRDISDIYSNVTSVKSDWGQVPSLDDIAQAVEETQPKGVVLCHNETSTGITNQAAEISKIAKKNDALFIMDAITSLGGIEIDPQKVQADVIFFGSQKCIAAPAGLSCISVSDRAKEEMYDTGYYLNLKKHLKKYNNPDAAPDTPYTPAVPLFLALREALVMLKEDGLENRIANTAKMAEATRKAAEAMGLELFPDKRYISNTLTAIKYPKALLDKHGGKADSVFRGTLKDKYGVIVAGSQVPTRETDSPSFKGTFFRIGHMGIVTPAELMATISAIESVLRSTGYTDFTPGAGISAALEVF